MVEVAVAVARAFDDARCDVALAATLQGLPNRALVLLDKVLADHAVNLSAKAGLCGVDAI